MPTVNEVRLMGHLARDPEMRYTPGGAAVANFTVATTWGSGDRKETEWHKCVVWNGKVIPWAEQVSKMQKGDLVYLEGRLRTSSWENNGEKKYKTEIVAAQVHFMRSSSAGQNSTDNDDDSVFPGLVQARKNLTDPDNEPPF